MELGILINDLIHTLQNSQKIDTYFLNRYTSLCKELSQMMIDINENVYPKNYNVLPMFHLIDRNADDNEIYEKMCAINNWYISNYRDKDEAVIMREMITKYLCYECKMSEKRAKTVIKGLGKHKEIYLEFASYVKNRKFEKQAISIEGYTAEQLFNNFPLSVVGAYNYLVYLIEEPQNALADLKAGLPRK